MIDLKSLPKGPNLRAPRIVLYGPAKIGKSTFAAHAPNPVFIDIEGGLDFIDTTKYKPSNLDDIIVFINSLASEDHEFRTLVIDSADWLEDLIFRKVAESKGKENIEDIPWGQGYSLALDHWRLVLNALDDLREQKNMNIILLAHVETKEHKDPSTENYFVYTPKLHGKTTKGDNSLGLITEWSDVLIFADYKVYVEKERNGYQATTKVHGRGERVLYTAEMPRFKAGNRYGLPEELEFSWEAFSGALREAFQAKRNPQQSEAA